MNLLGKKKGPKTPRDKNDPPDNLTNPHSEQLVSNLPYGKHTYDNSNVVKSTYGIVAYIVKNECPYVKLNPYGEVEYPNVNLPYKESNDRFEYKGLEIRSDT